MHEPEAGQGPYVLLTGSIMIDGHSQSPAGNFARTSTRPYLMLMDFLVLSRADLTGFTMVPFVVFVVATQSDHRFEVQLLLRRLIVLLVVSSVGSWRVGWM